MGQSLLLTLSFLIILHSTAAHWLGHQFGSTGFLKKEESHRRSRPDDFLNHDYGDLGDYEHARRVANGDDYGRSSHAMFDHFHHHARGQDDILDDYDFFPPGLHDSPLESSTTGLFGHHNDVIIANPFHFGNEDGSDDGFIYGDAPLVSDILTDNQNELSTSSNELNNNSLIRCFLLPKPKHNTEVYPSELSKPTSTDENKSEDPLSNVHDLLELEDLISLAIHYYGLDLRNLLGDDSNHHYADSELTPVHHRHEPRGDDDLLVLQRRKRSPQPRRSSSSSRRSSSSSSSGRTSSSSSSSSGSSSSGSSSGGSWWNRNTPSRKPSESSSSRGSSSSSSDSNKGATRNTAIGAGIVGAGAIGTGAAIGAGSSSSKVKPSAPPLETSSTWSGGSATASAPYPTAHGVATTGGSYPTSGSAYPTASAPYPTGGASYPTGGASYPTASAPYPTASAPYPTSGAKYPTAPAPYPTGGASYPSASAPYPTASAPYPTSGSKYPTAPAPYPTGGSPYPSAGVPYPPPRSPYPTAGAPYPTASAPYPTARAPYPAAGAHYPTSYPTASAPYPTSGSRPYPSGGSVYPGSYPGHSFGGGRGFSGSGMQTHSFPVQKQSKSKKVKSAIKTAIAAYAAHKAAKKVKKGFFSPSIFSHGRSHYGHGYGGYGYGGSGYGGFGHGGFGHGGFGHSSLGAGMALNAGGKIAKKILGAYVKIQIAKYAMKFGVEAAKLYFYHKLGYELRDETIRKFIVHNERKQRQRLLQGRGESGSNVTLPYNVTAGENCARVCRDNDTRMCMFTFRVHLYQTLTRACYDCPRNVTDCLRPECVTGAGRRRVLTVVNRQLPGPAIEVCHGDRVLVEVVNELPSSAVSLHWHGITMDDSPYMDGVPGLTQCSIPPRGTFMYSFKANFPGTQYWHGQEGLLRGEGLYGPLIVRKPDPDEPNKMFYDHDLTAHVIMVSDLQSMTSEAQFAERFLNEDAVPQTDILVNGRAGQKVNGTATLPYARIEVEEGKRYRVRIINAASLNCPVRVVAPSAHNFTVIAADGANLAAFYTHSLVINNGERWDVVLTADQPPGRYWLTLLGEVECQGRSQSVVVSYKASVLDPLLITDNVTANGNGTSVGAEGSVNVTLIGELLEYVEDLDLPFGEPITEDNSVLRANTIGENCSSPNITCLGEMMSLVFAPLPHHMAQPWVEDTLFLAFGAQPLYNQHFYSLLHYVPEFMPPKKRSKSPQVNNLSLRLPAKPLLLDSSPLLRDACNAEGVRRKQCVGDYCECLHRQLVERNKVVELVLINEGLKNETQPQPIHLHGYRFWVLSQEVYDPQSLNATIPQSSNDTVSEKDDRADEEDVTLSQMSDEGGFTRLHALRLYSRDKLVRNMYHPIIKDSIVIPPGGYAVVRFQAHNRGYWLCESGVLLQAAAGQAVVLQAGNSTAMPRPPVGFSKC